MKRKRKTLEIYHMHMVCKSEFHLSITTKKVHKRKKNTIDTEIDINIKNI